MKTVEIEMKSQIMQNKYSQSALLFPPFYEFYEMFFWI